MTREIALVCDAGPEIGSGHVMRMLTLGAALRRIDWRVILLAHQLPTALELRAHELGMMVQHRRCAAGDHELVTEIDNMHLPAIVLDSYEIPSRTIRAIGAKTPLILVDDNGEHADAVADILLNQNLHATSIPYGRGFDGATRLLGPRWALVRSEVTELRNVHRDPAARTVLVALGGTDPLGMGPGIVEALAAIPRVEVVHAHGLTGSSPFSPRQMADALATATIGVIACGTTTWEAACLGLPFIGVVTADNQSIVGDSLRSADLATVVDARTHDSTTIESIASAVADLLEDPSARDQRSVALGSLIDGEGAQRVAIAIDDRIIDR